MSFVASASAIVKAPRSACFAKLRDFPSWRAWMPSSFRPVLGPSRALRVGDVLSIWIAAGPLPLLALLSVTRVEDGRQIAWRGGIPGVLVGEHAFIFEDAEPGATLVRSEETWTGAVTSWGRAADRIRVAAERVGADQIAALARVVEKSAAPG